MTRTTQLSQCLALFSQFNPTSFPAHHAELFLYVARHEPCSYLEIEQAFNLSNSTVSRAVRALGNTHWKGYTGHDLLETIQDPERPKRLLIRLTDRGRQLVKDIRAI